MTTHQGSFAQSIQTLFESGSLGELTDRQLLERFAIESTETAELAFAVLLQRHGPMVLRTCTAILRDQHEAEDATQATFLVLARKARSIWVRDSLGPWLLGVARRVALSTRTERVRRRCHEHESARSAVFAAGDPVREETDAIVQEEVDRLPEGYRAAVVLCDLEGLTQEQAAIQLGWPAGTVRSRLSRGRGRLRDRLIRRGLAPAAFWPSGAEGRQAGFAILPASLADVTIRAAIPVSMGRPAAGVAVSTMALMEGALKAMFWGKLKLVTASILCGAAVFTTTAVAGRLAMGFQRLPAETPNPQAKHQDGTGHAHEGHVSAGATITIMTANEHARLVVLKKIHDSMLKRYEAGEIDLMGFLGWLKRHDEILEGMARTDDDRLRLRESQVAVMKHIEERARQLYRNGQVTETDALIAELERLEAEADLERFKARLKDAQHSDHKAAK